MYLLPFFNFNHLIRNTLLPVFYPGCNPETGIALKSEEPKLSKNKSMLKIQNQRHFRLMQVIYEIDVINKTLHSP
jgi:hypothetical protein